MSGAFQGSWEDAVRQLLDDPSSAQLVLDCYYESPLEVAARRYADSQEWHALAALLPRPPGRVLDVGAGRGIASYALAQMGWKVTALEPDPSDLVGAGAIRVLARRSALPIEVVEESGECVPVPDGSFDLVFARQALHHARSLVQLCSEVARTLRPGGVLIAAREHVISRAADLPAFLAAHPLHRLYGGENAFTLREYVGAIEGAGLRVCRVFGSFDSPINFAPHTEESLCSEIAARVSSGSAGRSVVRSLLSKPLVLRAVLRVMSRVDRRPGRLVTFLCEKPGE
jgi:SAM-dependent methyltransferase